MSDKGRSGSHSAKRTKPPRDPGRDFHPGAKVTTQAGEKHNPSVKPGGKGR
jgi:hypothetical protein